MSTITLPRKIKQAEELIAIPRKEYYNLIALKKTIRGSANLQKETDAWDALGDEALRTMRDGRGRRIRL